MIPEDGMRRFNDPDEWNVTLRARPDAFPERRRWAPWAVSLMTIAAVAVVGVIVLSIFGLGVQGMRNPVIPAVPSMTQTSTSTATPGAATPDDGRIVDPEFLAQFTDRADEADVDLGERLSLPWVVAEADDTRLLIAYVERGGGGDCGDHLGVSVNETSDSVTIAAVNTPGDPVVTCTDTPTVGVGTVTLDAPLGKRTLFHAAVSSSWADSASTIPTVGPTASAGPTATADSTATPATPAKAPYLTTEGLGDLRLGEAIPASNPFTTWDDSTCGARGGYALTKAYGGNMNFDISFVTTDRLKGSPLQNIVLRNDKIPTKSGIRVGDSLATLKATYPKFDQILTDPNVIYVIKGDKGEVAFELIDDKIVSIALFPIGTDYLSTQNGDGLSACSN